MQQAGAIPELRQWVEHALALLAAEGVAQVIGLLRVVLQLQVALGQVGQVVQSVSLLATEQTRFRVRQAQGAQC